MTRFTNGPAHGKNLSLRRAPHFLRVVIGPQGEVDALDQLDDEVKEGETPHAYIRTGGIGMCHLKMSKPGRSGFYTMADYSYFPNQPSHEEMIDNAKWRAWCVVHHEK